MDTVMMTPCSFSALLDCHADLAELFARHQEALLDRDMDAALRQITCFQRALLRHIDDEENVLMPVYKARIHATMANSMALVEGDHLKLKQLTAECIHKTEVLGQNDPPIKRRILALLDEEKTLKHVLEHHDQRERNILFPSLDRVTDEAERRELLTRCMLRVSP